MKKPKNKFDWLKSILGRSTFKTSMGRYIESTMNNRLWTEEGLNEISKDVNKFRNAVKGTLFAKDKKLMKAALKDARVRKDVLIQIKDLGEDFIVNDITDLTSLNNISNIVQQMISEKDMGMTPAYLKANKIANIEQVIENIHTIQRDTA